MLSYVACTYVQLTYNDVGVFGSVEGIHENYYMQSPISVDYKGNVYWFPLAKLQSSCKLDIRFYPFDRQVCYLKLGSWSYSEFEVDIRDDGETGIEKHDFVDNGEFQLIEFKVHYIFI